MISPTASPVTSFAAPVTASDTSDLAVLLVDDAAAGDAAAGDAAAGDAAVGDAAASDATAADEVAADEAAVDEAFEAHVTTSPMISLLLLLVSLARGKDRCGARHLSWDAKQKC